MSQLTGWMTRWVSGLWRSRVVYTPTFRQRFCCMQCQLPVSQPNGETGCTSSWKTKWKWRLMMLTSGTCKWICLDFQKNVQPQSEIAKTVAFSMERLHLSLRSISTLPTYPSIHAITAATNCSSLKSFGWWSPLIQWPLEMHTDSAGVHASIFCFFYGNT